MDSKNGIHGSIDSLYDLSGGFDEKVRPLINVIDSLRAIGVDKDIDLPTIAVMGDQSSGKSSVLEAISGVPLPRGAEIVTRCPLEMRLEKTSSPWSANIRFTCANSAETCWPISSKDEVTSKIEKATNSLAGPGGDVSDQLIRMTIRSPDCPDLTLIDLPGIVHSVERKQSEHLIDCIKNLITKYMSQERTIMLCVYPANMEIANCAIFRMANQYDPKGKRTIAIITKPDLVTDREQKMRICRRILEGGVYSLRQFYIVKARSPEELRQNLSREDLLSREAEFFGSDEIYKNIPSKMRGFPSLVEALTQHLVSAIRHGLPGLRGAITEMVRETQKKLESLPKPPPKDDQERLSFLTTSFHKFIKYVEESLLYGLEPCKWVDLLKMSENKSKEEPFDENSPPTMFSIWHTSFEHFMYAITAYTKDKFLQKGEWTTDRLKAFLKIHRGQESALFSNYNAYKKLIVQHLEFYQKSAMECLFVLATDLKQFIISASQDYFISHPQLGDEVQEICFNLIDKCSKIATERIDHLFEMERLAYCQDRTIFEWIDRQKPQKDSNNPSVSTSAHQQQPQYQYSSTNQYGTSASTQANEQLPTEPDEGHAVSQMQGILNTYFKAANNRIGDYIPTTLRISLHVEFSALLATTLLSSTAKIEIQDAITEYDIFKERREALLSQLDRLKKGQRTLGKFNLPGIEI